MKKISSKTIARVFLYIRTLETLIKEKRFQISSKELASMIDSSDAQIRKDISNFGRVGKPGIGYNSADLKSRLEDFVLQNNVVHVVLFGVGNLGMAILRYPGFPRDKIKIVAAFEKAKDKIGRKINGVPVYSVNRVPEVAKKTHADIAIIAVPKEHSQSVADVIALSGIRKIVNFSPTSLSVAKDVTVKNIDFTIEFLSLFCDTLL
ncbi:MAG: redox-sensing transcriptional repressor Rex [Candidatus Omnitrophota bacterium]